VWPRNEAASHSTKRSQTMRSIFGFHVTFAVDAIADMSGDAHA
jgi:hypothetical protein